MCAAEPDKPDIGNFDGRKFLSFLKKSGIVLQAGPGGKIRFEAPAGKFTAELRATAAEHRAELLELLASGPQDLQAHGDAAGPSGTDRLAGQALPGADPHGAAGSQDDHGLMGPTFDRTTRAPFQVRGVDTHFLAPGGGPQDLAAAPHATTGQAGPRRAAVPVAIDWPAAAADFALLLAPDDLPRPPFKPNAWTEVRDAGRFLAWLQADIRRGPAGPRAFYGSLQSDLQDLARFAPASADDRQRSDTGKAGSA